MDRLLIHIRLDNLSDSPDKYRNNAKKSPRVRAVTSRVIGYSCDSVSAEVYVDIGGFVPWLDLRPYSVLERSLV